jgi:hypothetical protein
MRQHLIPSLVASVIASCAAVGFVHVTRAPEVTHIVTAPAGAVSPAKAAHLAKTVWPELTQAQVDALTAAVKGNKGKVTIFCIDDAKCGDIALNLDNAFESAHWESLVRNSPMVPPGVLTSSKALADVLNAVEPSLAVRVDSVSNAGPGDYIAIGARP